MNLEDELEKDKIFESLYHYLWMKSPISEMKDQHINIPQTVLFQSGRPVAWFFSLKDGTIQKKNFANLVFEKIEEAFLKEVSESGIVAYFIYYNEKKEITVLYMDVKKFTEFLRGKTRPERGVLQKFTEPKGENNFTIQAVWSRNICMLSKRINRKNLYDKKFDIYEKGCTFDGPDFFSDLIPIKGNYGAEIRNIIERIAEHISTISFDRFTVTRILIYLKQDPNGKFWILWSNSARLEKKKIVLKKEKLPLYSRFFDGIELNNKPLALDQHIRIPQNVNTVISTSKQKPIVIDQNLTCINCNQQAIDKNFVEIPYKYFIEESELNFKRRVLSRLACDDKNTTEVKEESHSAPVSEDRGERARLMESILKKGDDRKIPELLRKMHPRLNNINYDRIKHAYDFTMKKVPVCELCYFHFSKYMHGSGENMKHKMLPQVESHSQFNFRPQHSRTVSENHKASLKILFEEIKVTNRANKACSCKMEISLTSPQNPYNRKSESFHNCKTEKSLENLSTKLSASFKCPNNHRDTSCSTPKHLGIKNSSKGQNTSQRATASSEFSFFRRRSKSDHKEDSLLIQESAKKEGPKVEILKCESNYGLSSSHNIRNKIRAKLLEKFSTFSIGLQGGDGGGGDFPKEKTENNLSIQYPETHSSSRDLPTKIKFDPRKIVQKSLTEALDTYSRTLVEKHPFILKMEQKMFKRKSKGVYRSSSCQNQMSSEQSATGSSLL